MFKFSSRPARVSTAAAAAKSRRSVASPQQPDWISIRRKERPQDLELAPHAVRWWHSLPSDVRPVHLVQKFPRIVNLLSLCWNDSKQVGETFESLLQDKRGTRQGFPTMILSELRRLRDHRTSQTAAAPAPLRDADMPTQVAMPKLKDALDMHWELTTDW